MKGGNVRCRFEVEVWGFTEMQTYPNLVKPCRLGFISFKLPNCISVLVKLELVYTHKIHYETVTFLATRTGHMSHLESSSRSLPRFAGKSSEYLAWRSAVRLARVDKKD